MTNREQEALRRSYRGKVSRCQGAFFEQMISAACNLYRERQIADIEKTPEPMQPTKDLGGGKFIAHYTGKGQADYKGFLWGGRAVNFEAKYTDSGKMMQDRVTKDQANAWSVRSSMEAWPSSCARSGASPFTAFPGWYGGIRRAISAGSTLCRPMWSNTG